MGDKGIRKGATTDDYRNATNGEGDYGSLGYEWSDKPHRLVYDLCNEVERLRSELKQAREIIGFYADEANWRARGHPQIDADTIPVSQDDGGRARDFLKDYEDV